MPPQQHPMDAPVPTERDSSYDERRFSRRCFWLVGLDVHGDGLPVIVLEKLLLLLSMTVHHYRCWCVRRSHQTVVDKVAARVLPIMLVELKATMMEELAW